MTAASTTQNGLTTPRFYQLSQVSEILNISGPQTYALVRSGSLPAIKIGGRGQWRVEHCSVEEYIERSYAETRAFVNAHPFGASAHDDTTNKD